MFLLIVFSGRAFGQQRRGALNLSVDLCFSTSPRSAQLATCSLLKSLQVDAEFRDFHRPFLAIHPGGTGRAAPAGCAC